MHMEESKSTAMVERIDSRGESSHGLQEAVCCSLEVPRVHGKHSFIHLHTAPTEESFAVDAMCPFFTWCAACKIFSDTPLQHAN